MVDLTKASDKEIQKKIKSLKAQINIARMASRPDKNLLEMKATFYAEQKRRAHRIS